jgi:hypothetical protein
MPEPVIIENRPRWAWALAALWTIETAAGLGFVLSGLSWLSQAGSRENGGGAVLLLMGVLLAAAGIIMTAQSLRIARLKGAAIVMNDQGLLDRRISAAVIPWEAIAWKVVFNGRSYAVQFSVAESERARLGVYWEQRALGRFNRLFGYPEFAMPVLGTGHRAGALAERMQRFKPAAA